MGWSSQACPVKVKILPCREAKREATSVLRSVAGQGGGSAPLRSPFRRRERGGTSSLCLWHVYSSVGVLGGVSVRGREVLLGNKGARARSPSRRRVRRRRRAAGVWCSRIFRSVEFVWSQAGWYCEDGGRRRVFWSPVLLFAAVGCALIPRWKIWGVGCFGAGARRRCSGTPVQEQMRCGSASVLASGFKLSGRPWWRGESSRRWLVLVSGFGCWVARSGGE